MFSYLISLFYSSYCFFFRVPIPFKYTFTDSGLFLGGLLQSLFYLLFFYLFHFLFKDSISGLFAMISLSLFTGFFHEDGLGDTADSLGVPHFNETSAIKCLEALKDSRMGAYGVNAIAIFWVLRAIFLFSCNQPGLSGFAAIGLSRTLVLSIGHCLMLQETIRTKDEKRPSHQLAYLPLWHNCVFTFFQIILYLFIVYCFYSADFSVKYLIFLLGPVLVFSMLKCLSRRTSGVNGDYLGSSICFLEVFYLSSFSYLNPSQNFNIWVGN